MEKSKKYFIGIDNGVSGSVAILCENSNSNLIFVKTPVRKELNYTKTKAYINRIDIIKLTELLSVVKDGEFIMALIERPMVNPTRWVASVSAIRALEATQGILETLNIPFAFIDSKEWQKALLPSGLKGDELKTASLDVGKRLYPSVVIKHPDYDGLLIAHYCKQKYK